MELAAPAAWSESVSAARSPSLRAWVADAGWWGRGRVWSQGAQWQREARDGVGFGLSANSQEGSLMVAVGGLGR